MSVARVYVSPSFAARKGKTIKCESCGRAIEKGQPYRWFKVGFRSNWKHIRCMRSECTPRRSTLESSKMSGIYAAIETAEDSIGAVDWNGSAEDVVSSLKDALETAGSEFEDVASEYSEAAYSMGGAGESMQNVADSIENAASDLQSWDPNDEEPDFEQCESDAHNDEDKPVEKGDTDLCEECRTIADEWVQSVKDEATEALNDAEGNIEQMY